MDYQQILTDLKKGNYASLYLLHGAESYFIDVVSDYIENHVLAEHERAFNQTILYGKEVEAKTLIDAAYRYPMMAERQVIILKEAQEMRTLKSILAYAEKPVATTMLVICHKHKKFNTNTKLGKAIKKNGVVLDAKKMYDNQVPAWITNYLRTKQLKINHNAADLLGEYLGTSLSKVVNELDKLAINLAAGTTITTEIVEKNVGISKDYNVFELQRALAQRDVLKANRIVNYFISNPRKNPLVLTIGTLFNFFSKVYQYHFVKNQPERAILTALNLRSNWFLREYQAAARAFPLPKAKEIIGLLREYDLKSKGVNFNSTTTPEGELLKELVWRILH
ncbi:MAG: DNA polymerase III subunit delta [Saprospiraceae bacterium]